uniref:Uncharacterized protein n=1 Tax=Anopheles darlingi TaxID=43151 RepID=A0A2M4D632_ANODA
MASKVHIASAFGCVLVLILLPLIFQVLWAVARAFRLLSPSSSMVSIMCYPATAVLQFQSIGLLRAVCKIC